MPSSRRRQTLRSQRHRHSSRTPRRLQKINPLGKIRLKRYKRGGIIKTEIISKCPLCESRQIKLLDHQGNLNICQICKLVFDNPRPTKESIQNYYAKTDNFDYWLSLEKNRDKMWRKRFDILLSYKKYGNLLDIGTGIGELLNQTKKNFKSIGTEISPYAVKIGKERYNQDIFLGEAENINFDKKFDLITLFHVLEHVSNPGMMIKKCHKILNDNGVLVIAVPNDISNSKTPIKKLLRKIKYGRFKEYSKVGLEKLNIDSNFGEIHLSHFTDKTLKYGLEKFNFNILLDSVDPYYCSNKKSDQWKYSIFKYLKKILGKNYYDTILMVAQKNTNP